MSSKVILISLVLNTAVYSCMGSVGEITYRVGVDGLVDCAKIRRMKFRRMCERIVQGPMLVHLNSINFPRDQVSGGTTTSRPTPFTITKTPSYFARNNRTEQRNDNYVRQLGRQLTSDVSVQSRSHENWKPQNSGRAFAPLSEDNTDDSSCVKCPSASEIFSPSSPPNHKTTAPWSYCLDYDPNRIPQYINIGMCSCIGCFNVDKLEYDVTLVPKNLTVQVPVMKKINPSEPFRNCNTKSCQEIVLDIPVGCYCHVPSY